MVRLEHLAADVLGLGPVELAALSGQLADSGVARRLEEVQRPADHRLPAERAQLACWLEAQLTRHGPPVAVLDSVRALAEPGTTCALAEVHPALLGGPLEQLLAAIQVVRLAEELSRSGPRVVPVLWCHGDTCESETLGRATMLNRFHEPQTVCLEPLAAGRQPLDRVAVDPGEHGLGALRAVLDQLYGDHPRIDEALDLLLPRAGETLPGALARAMHDLLGHRGLVVLEPEMLREELSGALARAVLAPFEPIPRSEELGLPGPDEVPVLKLENGQLQPLVRGGEGFRFPDEPGSRTPAELAAAIVQEPMKWFPGPQLSSLLPLQALPVCALVGTRGFLERQLTLTGLRERLQLPAPALVPAVRASLLDDETRGSLERLGLGPAEALGARGRWMPAEEAAGEPGPLERLAALEASLRSSLNAERRALAEIDPTLGPVVRTAVRGVEEAFRRLKKRVEHVQQNRGGKLLRHARRVNGTLCPDGRPQAEVLSALPWLSRHGRGWVEDLAGELDPFGAEHLLVHLGG